jgi:hypothetical protein
VNILAQPVGYTAVSDQPRCRSRFRYPFLPA